MRESVLDILFNRQMGEQGETLKHVPNVALFDREVDVSERRRIDTRSPMTMRPESGFSQSSNTIEHGGFAGAGRAEQNCETGCGVESRLPEQSRELMRGMPYENERRVERPENVLEREKTPAR